MAAKLMASDGGGRPPPSLWRTPTPYLFLGVGAMMAIIVVALVALLCTRCNPPASSSSSRRVEQVDAEKVVRALVPLDREAPRVVVIMAGERAPSFLASAKPLALASNIAAV